MIEQVGHGMDHDYDNFAYHSTSLSQSPAHRVGNGIDYGYSNSASWAASTPQVKEQIGNITDDGYVDSSLWTGVDPSSPVAEVRWNAHQQLEGRIDHGNDESASYETRGGMQTPTTAS